MLDQLIEHHTLRANAGERLDQREKMGQRLRFLLCLAQRGVTFIRFAREPARLAQRRAQLAELLLDLCAPRIGLSPLEHLPARRGATQRCADQQRRQPFERTPPAQPPGSGKPPRQQIEAIPRGDIHGRIHSCTPRIASPNATAHAGSCSS
ncbi:hypothetical protein F3J17_25850 [Burkholderia sp. Ax-1719]|nr:hypothetical protein [Burkholderia sp. Ax-1719]